MFLDTPPYLLLFFHLDTTPPVVFFVQHEQYFFGFVGDCHEGVGHEMNFCGLGVDGEGEGVGHLVKIKKPLLE